MAEIKKRVYRFGGKTAEGDGKMRELLGGKGANLAEMNLLGMPVPAGFTITTECCTEYYRLGGGYTPELRAEVASALEATEKIMGKKFGDPADPLLVSCRSGARSSMPGMMDTILNIGLCHPRNDQEDRQPPLRLRCIPPPHHDVLRRRHGEG